MSTSRDPDRVIHAFLLEGEDELFDQVYDRVRAGIEQKPQRVVIGPWRMPIMNKILGFGLVAAAAVAVVLIGAQLISSPGDGIGADPTASATSEPTAEPTLEPTPSASTEAEFPRPLVVTNTDAPVRVTVSATSSGWSPLPGLDAVTKGDDGLDPPESVGAALLAWAWPEGTGFNVYGDPCHWTSTIPESPALTPDEIAAAFAAQASTEATTPVDVTVGGYAGKAVTLTVPMTYDIPGADREERFAACDNNVFAFYGLESDETVEARNAQGAGQIDELWILDVDGSIVILDAAYSPATPPDLVEELRALAESATFEVP
jgi:hypothetical protein